MADEETFDLHAAGLRADGPELLRSVELLASKLQGALPTQTRVQRRGRLLKRDKTLAGVEVRLGGSCFALRVDGTQVMAWREREVGGISIKREPLDLTHWLAAITAELEAQAAASAQARAALERLMLD